MGEEIIGLSSTRRDIGVREVVPAANQACVGRADIVLSNHISPIFFHICHAQERRTHVGEVRVRVGCAHGQYAGLDVEAGAHSLVPSVALMKTNFTPLFLTVLQLMVPW